MELFFRPVLLLPIVVVWMSIKSYGTQLCGETLNDLRMGVPAPTTNFASMSVMLTETQSKAAISAFYHSGQDARELEDWLEMQPRRFLLPGINPDTYNTFVWLTSQFSGGPNIWWLKRKNQVGILDTRSNLWLQRLVRRPCCLTSHMTQLPTCFYLHKDPGLTPLTPSS
jgi:hypothetical protein